MKGCSTNGKRAGGSAHQGGGDELPPWLIILLREPEKVLRRLPRDLREDIDDCLYGRSGLAYNPRPKGCCLLKGQRLDRITVRHDWRIIYDVDDERQEVVVAEIGPRGGVYRER